MNARLAAVPLGKTDIQVSPLGIGVWAWGDRFFWGYGRDYKDADLAAAFQVILEAGINFFDTAEAYGQGRSEVLIGQYLRQSASPQVIATKFMPYPWRLGKGALLRALRASLKRLGLERVDLYQVHWPFPPVPIETWADALADAVQAGLARAVGVSNYNEEQLRRAYLALSKRGVALASNQVEYHLLNRRVEKNGLLKTCQELGVTLIAYSPLAQGILTGKYSPDKPPPGLRARSYDRRRLEAVQPLIRLMRDIGREHGSKTPSQVAINWLMCKGTVPIPGVKNARQAEDNCGAAGWQLSAAEITALDDASDRLA